MAEYNSVVIRSVRQSNKLNVSKEIKWSHNSLAQTQDARGRDYRQSRSTKGKPALSRPIPVCCPHMLKIATIVPVHKKSKVTELIDYRPEALISVIMKCFQRLIKDHITSTLPTTLNPLQFAYRPNRSTDDANAITLPYPI